MSLWSKSSLPKVCGDPDGTALDGRDSDTEGPSNLGQG